MITVLRAQRFRIRLNVVLHTAVGAEVRISHRKEVVKQRSRTFVLDRNSRVPTEL